MTENSTLSLSAVRMLLLKAQGLYAAPEQKATKADVLDCIRRIGALQIDTINVVARAPYFILFSRLGEYDPRWLEDHLAEGRLFEYWSHAACFLPIEDYALYRAEMERVEEGYYFRHGWRADHAESVERVLNYIRENGPVRSVDFERTDGVKGTWWNWKEEKLALEYLHTCGELMILKRVNFQRVYELRERVLAGWDGARAIPLEEARDELAVRAVRSLGAAPARWVPDYYRIPKQGIAARLERLADGGRLLRAGVEGWNEPAYLHPDNLSLVEWAARHGGATRHGGDARNGGDGVAPGASYTTLLSPFDPLVWDRSRARELFGFDYTIECYLPEAKRRYGYFSLPVLHRGSLIGRLDAKAYRKEKYFEVRSFHLEEQVSIDEELVSAVAGALRRCAAWHGAQRVEIRKSEPPHLMNMLADALVE